MAQVTVELRNLLRTNFDLFDFEYQFDDPIMKEKLEQAVIDYYYNYEIGQETPDEFKRRFKAKWLRMIDYYNNLHNTTLLDYNPLSNYVITEALEQLASTNNIQDTTGKTHAFSDSIAKESDYPQQSIAGGDFLSGENKTIIDTTTDDNTTLKGSASTNTNYSKTIEGITGTTYQDLIMKHRETLIRITNMVIEELKPCFILVH